MKNSKLTSVKVIESLYNKFKISTVGTDMTLQKLTNRCVDLYINNEEVVQTKDIVLYSYQNEVQKHTNQYFNECLYIYMDLLTNLESGDPYVS